MKLFRWDVTPAVFLVSITIVIILVASVGIILDQLNRDIFHKSKVVEQLIEDVGAQAELSISDESKSKGISPKKLGIYLVNMGLGLTNEHRESESDYELYVSLYAPLRSAIENRIADGISPKKPALYAIVRGAEPYHIKRAIVDYFAYLYSVEQRRVDWEITLIIFQITGFFSALIAMIIFFYWIMAKYANSHYQLANPPSGHNRSEPLLDFLTSIFPILTFKATRWDALKFMKSQFRRRVAMVPVCISILISLNSLQDSYEEFRRQSLIYSALERESKKNRYSATYMLRAEGTFHQSILITIALASVMGCLFIVPRHLRRSDTDKGTVHTPVG